MLLLTLNPSLLSLSFFSFINSSKHRFRLPVTLCYLSVHSHIYLHSKLLSSLLSHWLSRPYESLCLLTVQPNWKNNYLLPTTKLLKVEWKLKQTTISIQEFELVPTVYFIEKIISFLSLCVCLGAFTWIWIWISNEPPGAATLFGETAHYIEHSSDWVWIFIGSPHELHFLILNSSIYFSPFWSCNFP